MKKYDAILFDLDGTLLPLDQDEFSRGYFKYLYVSAAAPLGYQKETFVPAMWKGVSAMVKNDGSRPNAEAFWEVFEAVTGIESKGKSEIFDKFYQGEFHKAKEFTRPTPVALEAVKAAKSIADKVVLATNPLFPAVAQESRLSWAGISPDEFCLVTNYENSTSCKPNPLYYLDIAKKIGVDPKRCLMIGNNAQEDVEASRAAGMEAILITDCLINERAELPDCRCITLAELPELLKNEL